MPRRTADDFAMDMAKRKQVKSANIIPFNGEGIPEDLSDDRLEAIAVEIEALQATALVYAADRLAEAHAIFRYRREEGGFRGWVERRLHRSADSAYNLLRVRERFGGQCVELFDTLQPTVIFLLAKPSTPHCAVVEVCNRAEAGEQVSVATAKRLIRQYKDSIREPKENKEGAGEIPTAGSDNAADNSDDPVDDHGDGDHGDGGEVQGDGDHPSPPDTIDEPGQAGEAQELDSSSTDGTNPPAQDEQGAAHPNDVPAAPEPGGPVLRPLQSGQSQRLQEMWDSSRGGDRASIENRVIWEFFKSPHIVATLYSAIGARADRCEVFTGILSQLPPDTLWEVIRELEVVRRNMLRRQLFRTLGRAKERAEVLVGVLEHIRPDELARIIAQLDPERRGAIRRRLDHTPQNINLTPTSSTTVSGAPAGEPGPAATGPGSSTGH
jgi:hypothetical protein